MKILLDESVSQKLRLLRALLDAVEEASFDLFITADQEARYQQTWSPGKWRWWC